MNQSTKRITIIGGYGIFGGRIAEALTRIDEYRVRIVGRNPKIGRNFATRIEAEFRASNLDNSQSLTSAIEDLFLVIHAAGPYQGADYRVAEACLKIGAHSLNLADAREFVAGIGSQENPLVEQIIEHLHPLSI